MATFRQVVRHKRKKSHKKYNRSPKMVACPQKIGICLKVGTTKPKKPNSAIRKIAKLKLVTGYNIRAVIPGSGFNLMEHNTVLVRAGRARDIPGIHYKLIRNKYDLGPPTFFRRQNRRSKFGVTNWVYLLRTPEGDPFKVVSILRSRRHAAQSEWGFPLGWEKGKYRMSANSRTPLKKEETNPRILSRMRMKKLISDENI